MSRRTDPPTRTVRYRFRAIDATGGTARGELWARHEEAARHQLAAKRLLPIELEADHRDVRRSSARSPADLAVGLRILGSLLDAQLPLERVFSSFGETAPRGWSPEAIDDLGEQVRQGRGLAEALDTAIPGFPRHVRAIIAASEDSGAIGEGCRLAAAELELATSAMKAVRGALAYPALLAMTSGIATCVLVGVVLPRFAALFSDLDQALPLTTRAVLAASSFARMTALPALLLTSAALGLLSHQTRTRPDARRRAHAALLRTPVVGDLVFSAAGSRIAGMLASLLRAGEKLPKALAHAVEGAGNAAIAQRVSDAAVRVHAGERLSRSLAVARAVPPLIVQLAQAGEETGDLAEMLAFGARLERERMQERLATIVRVLEPALILGFGGLIAIVATALLQAIYSVRPI